MAKFKMEMELTGFKIKFEGDREDVPLISQNVGQQFAGLFEPIANIAEGEAPRKAVVNSAEQGAAAPAAKKRRKKAAGSSPASAAGDRAVDWRHDPEKFGSPDQEWTTAKKAMWLLRVAKEAADVAQMDSGAIADTFNKHFKQAGAIRAHNVSRDLGKLKAGKQAPVGEDTTKSPTEWYLTQAGLTQVGNLDASDGE